MRPYLAVMMLTICAGCKIAVDDSVICKRSDHPRTVHAADLAQDGGPLSRASGRTLIAVIDAGCK